MSSIGSGRSWRPCRRVRDQVLVNLWRACVLAGQGCMDEQQWEQRQQMAAMQAVVLGERRGVH